MIPAKNPLYAAGQAMSDALAKIIASQHPLPGADLLDAATAWAKAVSDLASADSDLTVVLEGGTVSSVISNDPAMIGRGYDVIDYDTQGADDEDLSRVKYADGKIVKAATSGGYVEKAEVEILDDEEDDEG